MNKRSKLAALIGVGLLTFGVYGAVLAAPPDKVDICHATGSNGNPYTAAQASKTADAGGHAGHTGGIYPEPGWGDIIPPFAIDGGGTFAGLNWTAVGQDFYDNGACDGDGILPQPSASATPVVTGQPATDTLGTGSSGPSETAWLLVVALGVILASVVILTPARAKSRR